MSDKKMPPPPAMPPSIMVKDNQCLFHKGTIEGEIYTCPSCKTTYCLECAKKAIAEKKTCIKCKQLIFIK